MHHIFFFGQVQLAWFLVSIRAFTYIKFFVCSPQFKKNKKKNLSQKESGSSCAHPIIQQVQSGRSRLVFKIVVCVASNGLLYKLMTTVAEVSR